MPLVPRSTIRVRNQAAEAGEIRVLGISRGLVLLIRMLLGARVVLDPRGILRCRSILLKLFRAEFLMTCECDRSAGDDDGENQSSTDCGYQTVADQRDN